MTVESPGCLLSPQRHSVVIRCFSLAHSDATGHSHGRGRLCPENMHGVGETGEEKCCRAEARSTDDVVWRERAGQPGVATAKNGARATKREADGPGRNRWEAGPSCIKIR
jgi:hypothetical protein